MDSHAVQPLSSLNSGLPGPLDMGLLRLTTWDLLLELLDRHMIQPRALQLFNACSCQVRYNGIHNST